MAKWEEAPEIQETPKWTSAPEIEETTTGPTDTQAPEDSSLLGSAGQVLASLATGMVAQPLAGIAGLGAMAIPGVKSADIVNKVQNALTYQPKSEGAIKTLGYAAYPFEKLAQGSEYLGGLAGGDTGAMLGRIAGEALPMFLPGGKILSGAKGVEPALAALRNRAAAARAIGYKLPPVMAGDTSMLADIAQGGAGKIKTQQEAAIANQSITNNLVKKDLGIPEDKTITPGILSKIRSDAGQHYEAIKSLPGKFKTTDEYIDGLFAIGKDSKELAKEFPNQSTYAKEVKPLIDSLARPEMTPANAINLSKKLRFDADTNLKNRENPAKLELGVAQKRASKLIEDMIESNLQDTGNPELLGNFQKARTTIAKTYAVEKALNESTGTVQAGKLGAMIDKGKPMTGGMQTAAEFARSFPKAAQTPEMIGGVSYISPLDLAAGAGYGVVGGMTKGPLGSLAAMIPGLRPLARKAVLSDWYQRGNRSGVKGPLSAGWGAAPFAASGLKKEFE